MLKIIKKLKNHYKHIVNMNHKKYKIINKKIKNIRLIKIQ